MRARTKCVHEWRSGVYARENEVERFRCMDITWHIACCMGALDQVYHVPLRTSRSRFVVLSRQLEFNSHNIPS